MNQNTKFNDEDRQMVIYFLEKVLQTKLTPIHASKTFYKDSNNRFHIIKGGIGNYHGIEKNKFSILEKNGFITVIIKHLKGYSIYHGFLEPMIENKEYLSESKKQYQFHFTVKDKYLFFNEIPNYKLINIGEASSLDVMLAIIDQMTAKDIANLLTSLEQKLQYNR